jgi:hypothetical protein
MRVGCLRWKKHPGQVLTSAHKSVFVAAEVSKHDKKENYRRQSD